VRFDLPFVVADSFCLLWFSRFYVTFVCSAVRCLGCCLRCWVLLLLLLIHLSGALRVVPPFAVTWMPHSLIVTRSSFCCRFWSLFSADSGFDLRYVVLPITVAFGWVFRIPALVPFLLPFSLVSFGAFLLRYRCIWLFLDTGADFYRFFSWVFCRSTFCS